jgi:hypothetical protein
MDVIATSTTSADEVAVGAASATFPTLLMTTTGIAGQNLYQYCSNVASWIAQGAAPTATAGPGSMYVPANTPVLVDGAQGAKLAVIEDSSAGKASLARVMTTGSPLWR